MLKFRPLNLSQHFSRRILLRIKILCILLFRARRLIRLVQPSSQPTEGGQVPDQPQSRLDNLAHSHLGISALNPQHCPQENQVDSLRNTPALSPQDDPQKDKGPSAQPTFAPIG